MLRKLLKVQPEFIHTQHVHVVAWFRQWASSIA